MAEKLTERVLDEDDRADVEQALQFVQARWREIGTQLHLKAGTLNNFDGLNPATATGRMVEAYIAGNYNVKKFGPPTWSKIIQAVESPAGGSNAKLATTIADTYARKEKFKSSYSSSNVVSDKSSPTVIPPEPEVQSYAKTQVENFPPLNGTNVVVDGPDDSKIQFERFEQGLKKDWLREVPMTFGPVKPKEETKIATINEAYNMSQWPHGVCVIINNEEFKLTQHKTRKGTDKDEYNLILTFRHLGYIVEVHRDCTKEKIFDILEKIQERDHSKYDSFVCCILSHGNEGFIIGSDSEDISLEYITNKFNGDRCPKLASKPKLFFFQACRGTLESTVVEVSVPEDKSERVVPDSDTKKIPNNADFFFSYATPLRHTAWRDQKEGSWYVTELCRSLIKFGTYSDLQSMVTWVNREVAEKYSDRGIKQQPVSTSRLHKNVFFFEN